MPPRHVPALFAPFGLVGAAAGWLAVGFLSHPMLSWIPERPQSLAALTAGLAGAAAGAVVTNRSRSADRSQRVRLSPGAWMAIAVVTAGAITGGAIGFEIWAKLGALIPGAFAGAACAVVFLPICAVVLAAALRSMRARMGTIVAAVDRRAIWRTLAGSISLASLLGAPDWAAAADGASRTAEPALGIAIVATVLIAAIAVIDVCAARRLQGIELGSTHMEAWVRGVESLEARGVKRLDLGLGDDVRAEIARGVAYRSADRATALLVGDLAEAIRAAKRARNASIAMLAFAASILGAHAYAMSTSAELAFAERRCVDGKLSSCIHAAHLFAAKGDLRSALAFHTLACSKHGDSVCPEAAALRKELGLVTAEEWYESSCYDGDNASCRALASLLFQRRSNAEAAQHGRELLEAACSRHDEDACLELRTRSRSR